MLRNQSITCVHSLAFENVGPAPDRRARWDQDWLGLCLETTNDFAVASSKSHHVNLKDPLNLFITPRNHDRWGASCNSRIRSS